MGANSAAAEPTVRCEVRYQTTWQSQDAFGAGIVIRNTGPDIEGWTLQFSLPDGQRVTAGWPVEITQPKTSAGVTISSNADWNRRIPSGGEFKLGFNGSWKGANREPSAFLLNGAVCNQGLAQDVAAQPLGASRPTQQAGTAALSPPRQDPPPGGSLGRSVAATIDRADSDRQTVFRVDAAGDITKDGAVFPVRCGSWFGLEGRHEPSQDPTNPSGAPMELYIGNSFWANGNSGTGRTIEQTMREIVALGINVVRLPVVPQTLDPEDPQGTGGVLKNHPSVRVSNARKALEEFLVLADRNGIDVMLDLHSCSNRVAWRAGRLDARPPYVDADRDDYDFTREDSSCAASGNPSSVTQVQPYDRQAWLNDLRTLAGLDRQLGIDNIIGIDIFNEPWDYTWKEWKELVEAAYAAIDSVNPNTLIFVQGISASAGKQDGTPDSIVRVPHGDEFSNPNWGENLFEADRDPIEVPKERLVFSPHTYGPSVFVQRMFMDPSQPRCADLEGDAAGDADCNIVIDPEILRAGWDEHFGYLKSQGYAVVVGEFGGNLDWPKGQASLRDQRRWGHIPTGVDAEWQEAFVDYMVDRDLQGCYWSINPESGDTGGLYRHAYDPASNRTGWGEWRGLDTRKTELLRKLWGE